MPYLLSYFVTKIDELNNNYTKPYHTFFMFDLLKFLYCVDIHDLEPPEENFFTYIETSSFKKIYTFYT
jgi:hypothetical protein